MNWKSEITNKQIIQGSLLIEITYTAGEEGVVRQYRFDEPPTGDQLSELVFKETERLTRLFDFMPGFDKPVEIKGIDPAIRIARENEAAKEKKNEEKAKAPTKIYVRTFVYDDGKEKTVKVKETELISPTDLGERYGEAYGRKLKGDAKILEVKDSVEFI